MTKADNIKIFQDTDKLVRTNPKLTEAVANSNSKHMLILEDDNVDAVNMNRYKETANVSVSSKRSFEAASAYKGAKTCVLNFASSTSPGGGVVHGSFAQEESLCRCSTLYYSLNTREMWRGFYGPHNNTNNPLNTDDIIYTPDVVVFKSDTVKPELMREEDWYQVNVITCAAPNLKHMHCDIVDQNKGNALVKILDQDLYDLHAKRLRRILDVAAKEENDIVILGAFGCGAFENEPAVVAKAAADVIEEYLHCFKVIEFAVFCTARDTKNYQEFQQALKKYL